ncbi:MAG: glycoside-pentoside-hexuronide (GPH):cation symporter [Oscillospiraceae bacterium]|nr:glycoside-pentoside-hexuronide (GPH):cation symporter [Oscillospiraceae bacterium]
MVKNEKTPQLDSQGIPKTMKGSQFFGDGIAQFALNSMSGLVGIITYFYTDKIGMSAAAVGTVLLASKIVDAFTDIIMGRVVDKTNSKYGKARPWILWMSIPAFLAIILLFLIPSNASEKVKIAYAFGSNIFISAIVYTAIAIPYGCLMALSTKSIEERSKMGIVRAVMGYISGMIIAICLIPITNMLGGNQKAWIIVSTIFGVLSAGSLLGTFFTAKEQCVEQKDEEKVSFSNSIRMIFHNKCWVIMLFVMVAVNIIYSLSSSVGVYYTKYILGNENLVALLGGIGLIPTVVGFAVIQPMIKKFGLVKAVRVSIIIGIIGTLVRIFFPYNLVVTIIFGSFVSFSTIPLMAVGGVLVNNTIEYNEWKFGKRLVGISNSASSFGSKIGSGLGAAMIGWVLAFGKYNGSLSVQPESAQKSIITLAIWIPGILLAIMYLLLRKYDLDVKYSEIIKDLEERRKGSN